MGHDDPRAVCCLTDTRPHECDSKMRYIMVQELSDWGAFPIPAMSALSLGPAWPNRFTLTHPHSLDLV